MSTGGLAHTHRSPPSWKENRQKNHHPPTRRPLAEPPRFNYYGFIEDELPSDLWFSKLFPDDLEKWVRCRDAETEKLLLDIHSDWVWDKIRYESI